MGTLAVRLTLPLAGCVEDFHLLVSAPCRAHQEKKTGVIARLLKVKSRRLTARSSVDIELFLVQCRIALHNDRPLGQFFHLV
jgi:hypothetical protein